MSDRFDDHSSIFTDPDADNNTRDPFTDEAEDSHDPFTDTHEEEENGDMTHGEVKAEEESGDTASSAGGPSDGEEPRGTDDAGQTEDAAGAEGAGQTEDAAGAEGAGPAEKNEDGRESRDPSAEDGHTPDKKEKEHDFDNEPKFDTQTGEPLDKPKSKVFGILLTLAVTAGVACAIGAAVYNRDSWNSSSVADEVETEPANPAIAGDTEASSEGSQTEAESRDTEAETGEKVTVPEKTTEKESGKQEAARPGTAAAPETEADTEKPLPSLSEELGKNTVSLNTSLDVSGMVEKVLPSVVSVTSQSVRTVESFFYGEQQIRESNVGSGIIIDEDDDCYYIVTDANLAARADDLTVGFAAPSGKDAEGDTAPGEESDPSGETEETAVLRQAEEDDGYLTNGSDDQKDDTLVSAMLVGADAGTELAVLAVEKDDIDKTVRAGLKKAVLGDSDDLRIGQRAVAIGDALGYGQSVTQGIISALGRTMQSDYGVHEYIQTDASINYGNYGGALLNLDGQVIGINAGKVSRDSAEGMGYALPVNDAVTGIENILDGKGRGLDLAAAEEDGKQTEGAGSGQQPATEVITAPSQDAGSDRQTDAELATEKQTEKQDKEPSGEETQSSGGGVLGVHVGEISEENRIIYRVPAGVYVASVDAGSGAEAAGLKEGDVITAVDGQPAESVAELKAQLEDKEPGDKVKVEYSRPDKNRKYGEAVETIVTLG